MPERRPNRAHGAVEKLPPEIHLQIKDWLVGRPAEGIPRLTYVEISERLCEMGYQISKGQVFTWVSRNRDAVERMQIVRERAEALIKYLKPDDSDVEQAAVALAGALCLEALADADLQKVQSIEDFAKVANSLGRLQSSAVQRDKWESEKSRKIEAAVEQLKQDVMHEIENDPELAHRILDHVIRAGEKMKEKAA